MEDREAANSEWCELGGCVEIGGKTAIRGVW